jgi:hypothetical protein
VTVRNLIFSYDGFARGDMGKKSPHENHPRPLTEEWERGGEGVIRLGSLIEITCFPERH